MPKGNRLEGTKRPTDESFMFIYILYMLRKTYRQFTIMRAAYRRRRRLLFPSPAEVHFIRIMGGHVLVIPFVRDARSGYPLVKIITLGRVLKREYIQREVRCGAMFIDFGTVTPYYKKGIEIDGRAYHQDVLKEHARDRYCAAYGWRLLHIQARDVFQNPAFVRAKVLQFLEK